MYKHILIDGRNLVYRAIYAGRGDNTFMNSGLDLFVVFARFLHYYHNKFRPSSIHIFWDDDSAKLWRTKILPTYKGQRTDEDGAKKDVFKIMKVSLDVYQTLGIHQYFRYGQEADDLIYAFAMATEEPVLIISSDSDLRQITHKHVSIYDPSRKEIIEARINPKVKALMGDKSDNIDGYFKIGPKTANTLVDNPDMLEAFLKSSKAIDKDRNIVGDFIFNRNVGLVDFSKNPYYDDNASYISCRMKKPVCFDYTSSINKIKVHNVKGIMREAYKLFSSFSTLS